MILSPVKNFLASGDLRAQLGMAGIMKFQGRMIFYQAGIDSGLIKKLEVPSTIDELAVGLNIKNSQLLSSLLDLGCALKEISCRNGVYRLKGPVARALVKNTAVKEMVRETAMYHADVAVSLGRFLLKGEKGDYLGRFGGIIAESSRIMEPLIKSFIYHSLEKSGPLSILEIGCGSGEYLRYYADINRGNSGTAIDIDRSAVAIAERRIKDNGLEGRFTAFQGNILETKDLKGRRFDLVTSYSNIYYFSGEERNRLYNTVRSLLNDNGKFMLATGVKMKNLSSCYYDLIFSATKGLYPLPEIDELVDELKRSGFSRVETVSLMGRTFMGIVAYM